MAKSYQKDKVDEQKVLNLTLKSIERELKKLNARVDNLEAKEKESDYLISVKEAARMLHVSEYAVRCEIKRGNIPAKQEGRAYHLSYNEVQRRVNNKFK